MKSSCDLVGSKCNVLTEYNSIVCSDHAPVCVIVIWIYLLPVIFSFDCLTGKSCNTFTTHKFIKITC